ncbi:cation diffusion facilitator family transporter NDAI_0F01430 [Naumovozyma dairenensis CBS 421]|uniref:Cation efflux protein transmembrane domain-containing protein n=1 Tax=Naumovozyma dairenensis (strain ATCC 10597 / BCRC 20456 / CBS 421 / NBRC 0211 / NRRL Y-12639) TaxID=1071378 RepID=G0WCF1_NAUDC|nr:hypothetical protein NDAI_0F01430 [Naumovozyma dairenensis CBS 421]CCD25462.1 hypothetical protein NDAI_0F01430 [Naumovozyma dairenensis CBS 421]
MIRVGIIQHLRLHTNYLNRSIISKAQQKAAFHAVPQLYFHETLLSFNEKKKISNPNLEKLNECFSTHDHIHMRESETETNDSFKLGTPPHKHTHKSGHTHSHEANPLLKLDVKEIKYNPGVRITWIGLASNVAMAVGKFVGGIVFHSQALFADSIHALSDLVSDFLTLFSVKLATTSKPNRNYPYGYGKVETVGSLAVSTILAMAGVSIGWTSLCSIVGPIVPHVITETITGYLGMSSHGHSHSIVPEGVTNINAAWIAGGSIVVKEWIFQATKKIAVQTNSNVLMANAWHHRIDSLTSLVALVAITGSYFLNIQSLDAIGGLAVSTLVVKAGGQGMYGAMKELIDQSLSVEDSRYIKVQSSIEESLAKLVSNNNSDKPYKIRELTVLSSGRNLRASVILEVPLQKWDNVLGIHEFENVSNHLRNALFKEVENLGKLDIEFVEEKSSTMDGQDTMMITDDATSDIPERHSHIHSHSELEDSHPQKH